MVVGGQAPGSASIPGRVGGDFRPCTGSMTERAGIDTLQRQRTEAVESTALLRSVPRADRPAKGRLESIGGLPPRLDRDEFLDDVRKSRRADAA